MNKLSFFFSFFKQKNILEVGNASDDILSTMSHRKANTAKNMLNI